MWILNQSGIMGNERADEAAKTALEEDINDQDLYPPQDLINWLNKTDAKTDKKGGHYEIEKGNYRVERRLNQLKQKEAIGGIQTKDGVHKSNR
jgi:hypothetical protein